MDQLIRIELSWANLEAHVMYSVYKGMRLWLDERGIEHSFEFGNNSAYFPRSIVMDSISAAAFKLIF